VQLFNRYVSPRGLTVFGCEILLIFGSVAVAARAHGAGTDVVHDVWKIALITGICQLCFYYNDLYDLTIVHSSRELLIRLLQAAGVASILVAVLYVVMPSLAIGNRIFISSLVIFLLAIVGWRLIFNRLAYSSQLEERVLIVGTGPTARTVARQIQAQHDFGYRVVGFIDDADARGQGVLNPATIGAPEDIPRIVTQYQIDRIVVGLADRRGRLPISELLEAKLSGVRVEDATTTYERLTGKILIDGLRPSWLIFSDGFVISRWTRLTKRLFDLALASVGFLLAAPLTLLTALAVYLDSDGPVLYCQERVGENGRTFTVYKFRSMRADAEPAGQPVWARENDDRITRVGRVIRKMRLDELPQLWNVLRGDMSFVGPRPERPFFVEQLAQEIPFYQQRHAVKPGVTGWAQVKYEYGSSIEDAMEKLRYDLYYIKHLSIALDLSIVLDTVKVVIFGKGAK
jgi:sugar transferase (PEP-CTERM system associated)